MSYTATQSTILTILLLTATALADLPLRDPGFEKQTAFWAVIGKNQNSGLSFLPGKGKDGSTACQIASPLSGPKVGVRNKGFINGSPGRTYVIEVDFKSQIENGFVSVKADIWKDTDGPRQTPRSQFVKTVRGAPINESTGNRWSCARCDFIMPEGADGFITEISSEMMEGKVLFDNVRIYELDQPGIKIPCLDQTPPLDGKLDRLVAAEALHLVDFMQIPDSKCRLAKEQTEVYLAMTGQQLLATILLHHDGTIPAPSTPVPRDGKVFASPSIEFFITFTGRSAPYFHFAIDVHGGIYDSLEHNAKWNSNIKTAVGRMTPTCAVIQFQLPLTDIGYNHVVDHGVVPVKWKLNFARNHGPGGIRRRLSSWAKLTGSFHETHYFRDFCGFGDRRGQTVSDKFWKNSTSKIQRHLCRFWPVKKTLCEELFSKTPQEFTGESAFMWLSPINEIRNVPFALQYGVTYDKQQFLDTWKRWNIHPYCRPEDYQQLATWANETGVGLCLYFPYWKYNYETIFDGEKYNRNLNDVKTLLEQNPGCTWGISLGDEILEYNVRNFIRMANSPHLRKQKKGLRKALEVLKQQYGHGKFSVPSAPDARGERFQWLATKRFMLNHLGRLLKDLHSICQTHRSATGKPLVTISADPVSGGLSMLMQQHRDRKYCDIFTGQILPPASPFHQSVAFATKILRDISQKTVWPVIHFEPYYLSHDSETVSAYVSEMVRAGGSGIQLWNYDYAGDVRKMGGTQFDYYGHRPRWNTMHQLVSQLQKMPKLNFPKEEFALYLSSDSILSHRIPIIPDYEALFTLLGPVCGSWFRFISGDQLADGDVDLNQWKTVFIPFADIENSDNQERFRQFVHNGGTLICFHSSVFSFADDGTDTTTMRESIFGVRCEPTENSGGVRLHPHALTRGLKTKIILSGTGKHRLLPLPGTKLLGTYQDGTGAATVCEYAGGGRAVLIALPMRQQNVTITEWRQFITVLLRNLGIALDTPIWHFSFHFPEEKAPVFKRQCLTGNNFYWWLNDPVLAANIKLKNASYTYSVPPDNSTQTTWSFATGRLTNRLKAFHAGDIANRKNRGEIKKGRLTMSQFADTWTGTAPLKISVDLGTMVTLDSIRLIYSGTLPSLHVTLDKGITRTVIGQSISHVSDIKVELPSVNTRTVTIDIAPRNTKDAKLILSEMELWGKLP